MGSCHSSSVDDQYNADAYRYHQVLMNTERVLTMCFFLSMIDIGRIIGTFNDSVIADVIAIILTLFNMFSGYVMYVLWTRYNDADMKNYEKSFFSYEKKNYSPLFSLKYALGAALEHFDYCASTLPTSNKSAAIAPRKTGDATTHSKRSSDCIPNGVYDDIDKEEGEETLHQMIEKRRINRIITKYWLPKAISVFEVVKLISINMFAMWEHDEHHIEGDHFGEARIEFILLAFPLVYFLFDRDGFFAVLFCILEALYMIAREIYGVHHFNNIEGVAILLLHIAIIHFADRDFKRSFAFQMRHYNRASDAIRDKNEFMRYMFHELRLPVNAMFMAVELLDESFGVGPVPSSRGASVDCRSDISGRRSATNEANHNDNNNSAHTDNTNRNHHDQQKEGDDKDNICNRNNDTEKDPNGNDDNIHIDDNNNNCINEGDSMDKTKTENGSGDSGRVVDSGRKDRGELSHGNPLFAYGSSTTINNNNNDNDNDDNNKNNNNNDNYNLSVNANASASAYVSANNSTHTSSLSYLSDESERKEKMELVKVLKLQCKSIQALLNDSLSLAKLGKNKVKLEFDRFSLPEMISIICKLNTAAAVNKNVSLVQIVDPKVPLSLLGDPNRIRQVIDNIISNAIKFCNENSDIVVLVDVISIEESDKSTLSAKPEREADGSAQPEKKEKLTEKKLSKPSTKSQGLIMWRDVADGSDGVDTEESLSASTRATSSTTNSQKKDMAINITPAAPTSVAEASVSKQAEPSRLSRRSRKQSGLHSFKDEMTGRMFEIKISVMDVGVGISQEEMHNLFTPFKQIRAGQLQGGGGTGLGLSIAKQIIELHDGKVGVVSEPLEEKMHLPMYRHYARSMHTDQLSTISKSGGEMTYFGNNVTTFWFSIPLRELEHSLYNHPRTVSISTTESMLPHNRMKHGGGTHRMSNFTESASNNLYNYTSVHNDSTNRNMTMSMSVSNNAHSIMGNNMNNNRNNNMNTNVITTSKNGVHMSNNGNSDRAPSIRGLTTLLPLPTDMVEKARSSLNSGNNMNSYANPMISQGNNNMHSGYNNNAHPNNVNNMMSNGEMMNNSHMNQAMAQYTNGHNANSQNANNSNNFNSNFNNNFQPNVSANNRSYPIQHFEGSPGSSAHLQSPNNTTNRGNNHNHNHNHNHRNNNNNSNSNTRQQSRRRRSKGLKGNIMIVEDNDINRRLLVKILSKEGLNCLQAVNGLEAVNTIKDLMAKHKQNPDPAFPEGHVDICAILMDQSMPVMGGLEATRQIRALGCETPIIAVTGNALQEDVDRFYECGIDFHLTKPVMKKKMLSVVNKFIRQTHARSRPR